MAKKDEVMQSIMKEVTESLTQNLKEVLSSTLETQLTTSLTASLLESEFYKKISKDMRSGLKKIYKDMSNSTQNAEITLALDKEQSEKLFTEASEQLNEVLKQTESATCSIMDIVEKHLDYQTQLSELIVKAKNGENTQSVLSKIEEVNGVLGEDLTQVLTLLSFQDLTGQRIRKVVSAIKQIEQMALELYVSSGLMIKAYTDEPKKELENIEEKAKDTINQVINSELKGPSDTKQADIDALLAQFDL